MRRIIALLRNINFWTIVGTLITIATVIVAMQERRSYEVDLIVDGEKPFELKKDETSKVVAVLFGLDSIKCDSIEVQLPLKFRNNENRAITIGYSIAPRHNFATSSALRFGYAESTPVSLVIFNDKILQRDNKYVSIKYLTTREKVNGESGDSVDCEIDWSYENMDAEEGHARFTLFCVNGKNKAQLDYIASMVRENPKLWVAVGYMVPAGYDNFFAPCGGGAR